MTKLLLDNRVKPTANVTRPANCILNSILCGDTKGVSHLYKALLGNQTDILNNICLKWYNKGYIILNPYKLRNSFTKSHRMVDDIHLRYTQFRTLHYRYFTNDVLVKCIIKEDDTCAMCSSEKDSNFHMLIDCIKVQALWSKVETWIQSLGMVDYYLTDRKKILGDLENTSQINLMLLNVKKTIYQSKLDCRAPTLLPVQYNLKQVFKHENYNSIINDKEHLFERKWSLLLNFFRYKAS